MTQRLQYQDFLASLGDFTEFITINIKKRHPSHQIYWRHEDAEPTALELIKRINERVYRRAYSNGFRHLSNVISYEIGGLSKRPHFHLVIDRPKYFTQSEFIKAIARAVKSMDWLIIDFDARKYEDSDCIRYICKGNYDGIILPACNSGN